MVIITRCTDCTKTTKQIFFPTTQWPLLSVCHHCGYLSPIWYTTTSRVHLWTTFFLRWKIRRKKSYDTINVRRILEGRKISYCWGRPRSKDSKILISTPINTQGLQKLMLLLKGHVRDSFPSVVHVNDRKILKIKKKYKDSKIWSSQDTQIRRYANPKIQESEDLKIRRPVPPKIWNSLTRISEDPTIQRSDDTKIHTSEDAKTWSFKEI